jgi:hypothetical protein
MSACPSPLYGEWPPAYLLRNELQWEGLEVEHEKFSASVNVRLDYSGVIVPFLTVLVLHPAAEGCCSRAGKNSRAWEPRSA